MPPPPPLSQPAQTPALSFSSRRLPTPQGHSSEAGVAYPLSERIAILMSYQRDGFGSTVPREAENAVVTSVKLGF
jgi:hypothetical protein